MRQYFSDYSRIKWFSLWIFFVMVSILLVSVAFVFQFISIDKTLPHWDYANNILRSYEYLNLIQKQKWGEIFIHWSFYPPLIYILFALIIKVSGYSVFNVFFFNLVLIILTTVIIYFNSRLFSSHLTSLFTALTGLIVLTQVPIDFMRMWELMFEYPLTLTVLLAYFLFIYVLKMNSYSWRHAFLLGLICAVNMLVKWFAFFYISPLVFFYTISVIKRKRWFLLACFCLPPVLLAGPWYFANISGLSYVWNYNISSGLTDGDPQGFLGIYYYLNCYWKITGWLLWIFLLLIICRAIRTILIKKKLRPFSFLCDEGNIHLCIIKGIFILSPLLIFGYFVVNKDIRYLYPFYIIATVELARKFLAKSSIKKLMFYSFIMITVVILHFPYARLSTPSYFPYESLTANFLKYKPSTVGYFFEQNSSRFNPPNIILLHEDKNYKQISFPTLYLLNNVMEESKTKNCNTSVLPDLIVVYSSTSGIIRNRKVEQSLSFLNVCPESFRKQYLLMSQEKFLGGDELTYYRRYKNI